MDDFALTPAERDLFTALTRRDVPFILLGMGAALLEGAPVATQDLDVWFERVDDKRIPEAAQEAGGFWIPGFGMQPPAFGGAGLDRIDVVLTAHGLEAFSVEYARTRAHAIEGVTLRVLPLERILVTKRATGRAKASLKFLCSKQRSSRVEVARPTLSLTHAEHRDVSRGDRGGAETIFPSAFMNTGMSADHRAQILRLTDRISAQEMPYADHDDVRKLCDALEEILAHVLAGEPTWTDWLDGLIDYDTERLPHQLTSEEQFG